MKLLLLIFALITIPYLHAMNPPQEEGRPRTARGRPPTLRIMTSRPLRYARNIVVVTYFISQTEYHYETMVVDSTEMDPRYRTLRRQISATLGDAFRTHEQMEEWCFWVFPELPPAPPLVRAQPNPPPPPYLNLADQEEVRDNEDREDSI
jgi:hypothetical protein